ncbi:MAG: hypothetical protein DI613_20660 [Kocuria rhizophila]|nr:MAG: hypothetical protein DI613_20660 [Kocuria rhizophila]
MLDQAKLEGALGRPLHTFGPFVAFPTVPLRAAVLMDGVAQAHAFVDGNKRTAFASAAMYLRAKGYPLRSMSAEESGGVVLALTNNRMTTSQVAEWILENQEA